MIQIDIDMPEKCGLCPLFHAEHPMHCQGVKADRKKKIVAPYGQPRPDWCPLHEADPDTVSRQAVIELIQGSICDLEYSDENMELCDKVRALPPSPNAPKTLDSNSQHVQRVESVADDTISRKAAIDLLEKIAELYPWRIPGNRDTYDRYNEAWQDAVYRMETEIEQLPSAPQRTGRWLPDTRSWGMKFVCSECKESLNVDTVNLKPSWNFCPNCGARMEGE